MSTSQSWTIVHGGALGDLALALQFVLLANTRFRPAVLHVISRTRLEVPHPHHPQIRHLSPEAAQLHWLYHPENRPPPACLADLITGHFVLNMLGGPAGREHERLAKLAPANLWSVDPRPVGQSSRHIIDQWQSRLEAAGVPVPRCQARRRTGCGLHVPDRPTPSIDVLIHPGSGGRRKCWTSTGYQSVAQQLVRDRRHVVLAFGEVERETWPPRELDELRSVATSVRCDAIEDLVRLLLRTRLFLGNDAGPGHLAALLGVPTLTLFGPTDARVWRPVSPVADVLVGDVRKDPAFWTITPEQIVGRLVEMRSRLEAGGELPIS